MVLGSFAVQFGDHLRSGIICGLGIICGAVQTRLSVDFPCEMSFPEAINAIDTIAKDFVKKKQKS